MKDKEVISIVERIAGLINDGSKTQTGGRPLHAVAQLMRRQHAVSSVVIEYALLCINHR
jgi:hypothetical protein